jgi:hypothetical protein
MCEELRTKWAPHPSAALLLQAHCYYGATRCHIAAPRPKSFLDALKVPPPVKTGKSGGGDAALKAPPGGGGASTSSSPTIGASYGNGNGMSGGGNGGGQKTRGSSGKNGNGPNSRLRQRARS